MDSRWTVLPSCAILLIGAFACHRARDHIVYVDNWPPIFVIYGTVFTSQGTGAANIPIRVRSWRSPTGCGVGAGDTFFSVRTQATGSYEAGVNMGGRTFSGCVTVATVTAVVTQHVTGVPGSSRIRIDVQLP
jgi:hypothetical protein